MSGVEACRAVEAVWRIEAARVIAGLARQFGDVGLAEEMAQEALVTALEQWPTTGIPDNPAAWLTTTAKRRAIDHLRRRRNYERKLAEIAEDEQHEPDAAALVGEIDDDLLRLVFTACHPVLPLDAQVALTLRLLGGLTTDEIARAYLTREATIAQRIVRAKKSLAKAQVPFEVPDENERPARLAAVLGVIYLIFNEGYSATAGDDWMRPELCADAVRLARVLATLVPKEPEVHGLVALLELQYSRFKARVDAQGEPVLLLDQDRTRWDRLLITRGLTVLEQAGPTGPYGIQAHIAACHARAARPEDTDWFRIAGLYEALALIAPSPVVELNHAVAIGMAFGPATGLELVDEIVAAGTLVDYHLLPSVRGDLLVKLDRPAEAEAEFTRAASLTRNERERALLLARAAACRPHA
ncbi:RNA polymerase sigma factor [Saccharothrix violaceirubra]|uniref:RNA polymerase sigma factor (Sigma-70 family) n=1 Tax=Saccharothrix violaceirubra TaxID=413306 RepID=A0A7W7SYQ4_9PSEU|nr:RNA polymerase sigma factor [Saccharothrix violaceirubra]MBB4963344.1 RNA polymerase sigma factor (sigma-70 family) [Saccharothrix violaceirubra]